MYDSLIIGGGVVGLSLAWRLAERGQQVCLVDRQAVGRATSWTGAGTLPPPERVCGADPLETLRSLSHDLYPRWSAQLRELTGIDNEFRQCGAVYLSRGLAESVSLRAAMDQRRQERIEVQTLSRADLLELEPSLAPDAVGQIQAAFHLPQECTVRNPRHLQALASACRLRGVTVHEGCDVQGFQRIHDRIVAVQTTRGAITADEVCVAAGSWAGKLLSHVGWELPIRPWRGQIVLWKSPRPILSRIVYEGLRYFVPRDDGHLLVGSTVEDVGFACHTTEEAVRELTAFARDWAPQLRSFAASRTWAGLRPGTPDGLPYLGRVPGLDNLTVAAGHFRSGLHLAPITAELIAALLTQQPLACDLAPFRLNR